MKLDLAGLNTNQRMAVEWNEGPLLVLSGPGSGKTRVLTMRVAKLLLDSPDKRFRVLGLTFTNKAAGEMRSRVEEMVPDCLERVLLTTFHSFCADTLRQHGSHIGIKPDFVILNQDVDREAVLLDAIKTLGQAGLDVEEDDVKILPIIDRLLANCVPESEAASQVRDLEFGRKLEALYAEYCRQLLANNRLDFPSLLLLTHRIFMRKPLIAKQIRTVYPHVCVDEFQDTNLAQCLILRDIVGEHPRDLFVVADDDQIIYQWNGASPERLQSLREDFKMSVVQLPANYRCPPEVIVLANHLIQHNLERAVGKEPIYAIKRSTRNNVVRLKRFENLDDELGWVARDILRIHSAEIGECVLLGRTRKLLEAAVHQLQACGLQASLTTRKSEFTSAPLRFLHAILRLANARGDREQLRRVCKTFYEIEGVEFRVDQVVAFASRRGGDLLRCWFDLAREREGVDLGTLGFLGRGQALIVDRLDVLGFMQVAFTWLAEKEKELAGQNEGGFVDFQEERDTWEELQKRTIDKYGREELTISILLQEFDLSEKSPIAPPNAVRCMTIHSAKGMEFRHVYLVGLVEDQLPSFQSIKKGDASKEMQEERRNCFVAITRAQETLTLTYASIYFGWQKRPSRFLAEMNMLPP